MNRKKHSKFFWGLWIGAIVFLLLVGCFLFFRIFPFNSLHETRPLQSFTSQNRDPSLAAESMISAYLQQYRSPDLPLSMRLSDYGIVLTEPMDTSLYHDYVHIQYWIQPVLPFCHIFSNWGTTNEDRIVCDLALKLELDPQHTDSTMITEADDYLDVQTVLQEEERKAREKEQYEYEIPHGFPQMEYTYCITDDAIVKVSYDWGKHWSQPIPVTADTMTDLVGVNYHNKLPDGSYYITPEITSFVYRQDDLLWCCRSEDQGHTWQISSITDSTYGERKLFSGWTSPQEGWVIAAYDYQMFTEAKAVFLTHDGGVTWEDRGRGAADISPRMLQHAGFVTPTVGFLSFGPANTPTGHNGSELDTSPAFYRTEDGGISFSKIRLPIPETYEEEIFVCAQAPVKEPDGSLSLLVDQGESGDYLGGKVCLRFRSNDLGKNWIFDQEFTPAEISFGG